MTMSEADIKEIVRVTVPEVLAVYGVDAGDPPAAQADMLYLRGKRLSAEKLGLRAKMTVMAIFLSSGLGGVIYWVKGIFTTGT